MSVNEFQHQPVSAEHGVAPVVEETATEERVGDSNPDVTGAFEDITPVTTEETQEETIARLQSENEQLRQQSGV